MNNRVPPNGNPAVNPHVNPNYPINRSPEDYVRLASPAGPPPHSYGGPTPPEFHHSRPWDNGYYPMPGTSNQPPPMAPLHSQQKVQMWQNNFITDSGVQTGSQSRATSMMSSLHARSHMSTSTVPGEIPPEMTEEQQMKFQNIQHNKHLEAVAQLIPLLRDADDIVAERAAHMMQHIAKKDAENALGPPTVNRQVVESLKELIQTKNKNEKIIRIACCTLFHISSSQNGLELITSSFPFSANFFADLVTQTRNGRDTSLFKYTLMTLHTIISNRTFEARTLHEDKRVAVLETIVAWLDYDVNEKVLAIVVDTMKLLVRKSGAMKRRFIDLRGLDKIMKIITGSTYGNLLLRSVQMVKSIATDFPKDVVDAGAFSVLPKHLCHSYHQLVISTLECIRGISFVKATNTSDILKNVLMLLGSDDKRVEQLCVAILSNLVANNQANKELLFENNGIGALLCALRETTMRSANLRNPNESPQRLEEIQERILATIQNMCLGHRFDKKVHAALVEPEIVYLILVKLTEMRPAILKQSLLILNKVLTNPANVQCFVNFHLKGQQGNIYFFDQICHILKTACNQISTVNIEDVPVVDLIWLPLSVLQHMSVDRTLLCSICSCLRRPENSNNRQVFLPMFALNIKDERVQRASLGLISMLVQHPEICQMMQDPNFCRFLGQKIEERSPVAAYADVTLKRLKQGGDRSLLGPSSYFNPNQPYPPQGYSNNPNRVNYPQPMQYTQAPQTAPPPPYSQPQHQDHHAPPPYGYSHQNLQQIPQDCVYDQSYGNHNAHYQEEMSNLSINDDPFVNVFCPDSDSYNYPNPQGYDNPHLHSQAMSRHIPSDYGSPADSSMQLGTPDPDHDPSWLPP